MSRDEYILITVRDYGFYIPRDENGRPYTGNKTQIILQYVILDQQIGRNLRYAKVSDLVDILDNKDQGLIKKEELKELIKDV